MTSKHIFHDPIQLPDLKVIEEMTRQRQEATDKLQVVDGRVKCQNPRCNVSVPMFTGEFYTKRPPNFEGLRKLESRLRNLESQQGDPKLIKEVKDEIAAIYEENDKNILRRCPLYFRQYKTCVRFLCSKCWERR